MSSVWVAQASAAGAPPAPTGIRTTGTTQSSVSLAWTSAAGATGYRLYRSGVVLARTAATSATWAGLNCSGYYRFSVQAYNASGSSDLVDYYASVAACGSVDAVAPTTPFGLVASGATQTGVTLSWQPSMDNVGVVGYGIFINGTKVSSGSSSIFAVGGLGCGTSYSFAVDAFDAAGNHSAQTATLVAATSGCPDTSAPSVPAGLAATGATTTSVSLAWVASTDDVGVTGYTAYRAGVSAGGGAGTSFTVGGLGCGTSYAFSVDAYDAAGNHSARTATVNAATSVCADTSAPSVPTGLAATGATTTSVSLVWAASTDNVGVTGYTTYSNGVSAGSGATTSYTVTGLACGTSYAFSVDAFDGSGNRSARSLSMSASTGACGGGGAGVYYLATNGSDSNPCSQASPCATVARALSLAQPGNTVQLLPGNYGHLTINRQSGSDSPKVIVRGDPGLASQRGCEAGCAVGNVTVSALTVCGHGFSIENIDTNDPGEMADFYVGASSCAGGNQVSSNYNIDLVNVHFNFGTLRCHDCSLQQSRIGPLTRICEQSSDFDGDNLHIWPDAGSSPWTVPYNLTLDRNLIYDAQQSSPKCNAQGRDDHSDLVQTLGYNNLIVSNNVFWKCANAMWQDGLINGTTIGNAVFRNNFFASTSGCNGGSTQIGNADPGGACANGGYLIENNTWLSASSPGLYCTNTDRNTWRSNYIYEGASQSQTCGSGLWDYNVFSRAGVTCGTHAKRCAPSWLWPTAGTADLAHGSDLHLGRTDTCLRGAAPPGLGSAPVGPKSDIDGDQRPLRAAGDAGADQREPAQITVGRSIGRASIGMSTQAVTDFYGAPRSTRARRLAPAGPLVQVATYRLHGGILWVASKGDRVVGVGTSSSYYTTARGVGVTSLGPSLGPLVHARWVACRGAYVVSHRGVVASFAAGSPAKAVRAVSMLRRPFAAPARCTT